MLDGDALMFPSGAYHRRAIASGSSESSAVAENDERLMANICRGPGTGVITDVSRGFERPRSG